MAKILVKPLAGLVIRTDKLDPNGGYVLDKLNRDLSFKKQLAKSRANSLKRAKREFEQSGKIKTSGWVETEETYTMDEAVKQAMATIQQMARSTA